MKIIGFGAVLMALAMSQAASSQVAQTLAITRDNRSITVTASDSAFAMADQAVVHIGYQVYGGDETSAYAEGSKRSNAINGALTAAGVAAESIESDDQSLQPLNDYEIKNASVALKDMKFRVTQSWSVRTTPADAAKVLDIAVKAGANQSGNIAWEMKDPSMLEAQAAGKALAKAQAVASRMGEGLHVKIGVLLYASNQAATLGFQQTMEVGLPLNGRVLRAAAPLSISARRVERTATVFAIFAIE